MVSSRQGLTWFGLPVTRANGSLDDLRSRLPVFVRQPFALDGSANEFQEMIVREPFGEDRRRIPVAAVSRHYSLVQHHELLDWLDAALRGLGDALTPEQCQLTMSTYGERIHVQVTLPAFDFDPGDGEPLRLVAHGLNSVDRTTSLAVSLGWWRQVCRNGLKIRVVGTAARRIHLQGDVSAFTQLVDVLAAQFREVPAEQARYRRWVDTPVSVTRVEAWADAEVAASWGPHAAARACQIARTGWDGEVEDRFDRAAPHERTVRRERRVPGAFAPVSNVFHVCQILSWLASHRGTVQERLERTVEIHDLMSTLVQQGSG